MFRYLARSIALNLVSLYIVTKVLFGVFTIEGGVAKFLLAALAISLANLIVRPVVNLLLIPINLVTLGLSRWLVNVAVLFAATRLVPQMQIHPFVSPQITLPFLILPSIEFSKFGAFIFAAFILSVIFHLMYWLFQD